MTSQASRDLLWTINSPSLIQSPQERNVLELPTCGAADFNASMLQTRLDAVPNHRVGRYFEHLINFYLEAVRGFEIVERGLQIQEHGRTVGEIDFLFRDASGSLVHCEAAVKFYLYVPESNDSGSHLIGPNSSDNFERKMQRLFEHQLPLSEERFPEVTRRQAFVKGCIFYHPLHNQPKSLPDQLSPDHLQGSWIRESELDLLDDSSIPARFRLVRKPHWLSPEMATSSDDTLLTSDDVKDSLRIHFAERRTPQLVSQLTESEEFWQESSRVFVVSDQWPGDGN
jgi:hypothetical protein